MADNNVKRHAAGALEGKLFWPTRDSCIVIIYVVLPNSLGPKPKWIAAAETWSSPPLWLLSNFYSMQHLTFPPFFFFII